jgi:hypothetical protein
MSALVIGSSRAKLPVIAVNRAPSEKRRRAASI